MRTMKWAWFWARLGALVGYAYLAYLRALARPRKSWVVEEWNGEQDLQTARHLAVFSHYDRYGVVHDYVLHYLKELRDAGYQVLFVSNAPKLLPEAVTAIQPLCCSIIRRKNVGYDFGAYKEGIARIPRLDRLEALIVANDSVYGPFVPLRQVLEQADPTVADVWSMTDSWEKRYHLQSYFLLFHRAALNHPSFLQFWRSVRFVQSKTWAIRIYEVGLCKTLLAGGLRCRALFPYRDAATALMDLIRQGDLLEEKELGRRPERQFAADIYTALSVGVPLNPTHFFWDHLIGRMGCPFIKRELLVKNPARVPLLPYWERAICQVSDYDTDLITRHLKQLLRNRSI